MDYMSWIRAAVVLAASGFMALSAGASQLPGSIDTADAACNVVNGNLYTDKGAVYVKGQGLIPSVSYYVRVTDPNGATVLGSSGSHAPVTTNGAGNFGCLQLAALVGGSYADTPNSGGVYKVWVSRFADFDNDSTKTDNFRIAPQPQVAQTGSIAIRKFYDTNADGVWQAGEPELPDSGAAPYGNAGWKVDLIGFEPQLTQASYGSLQFDSYIAREYAPTQGNWVSTAPTPIDYSTGFLNRRAVTVSSGAPDATVYFGNVCLGKGGGLTLGYWSNKNGQATMNSFVMANQLAYLSGLNLVNPDGSAFNPADYGALRKWLLNGNAVNMAYMLSVQMAAMALNMQTNKVTGTSLVYAPGAQSANSSGFVQVAALVTEANASLGLSPTTPAGVPARAYQGMLKTALDRANNNLTFVQSQPCAYTFAP